MSTNTSAKKAAAPVVGSLDGRWTLAFKKSSLGGKIASFDVAEQTAFADGSATLFGSVNTAGTLTALELQNGRVELDPDILAEVVSFQITYNGVVYQFKGGQRLLSKPNIIDGGVIVIPDDMESGEDGSWSAQATPAGPDDQ